MFSLFRLIIYFVAALFLGKKAGRGPLLTSGRIILLFFIILGAIILGLGGMFYILDFLGIRLDETFGAIFAVGCGLFIGIMVHFRKYLTIGWYILSSIIFFYCILPAIFLVLSSL